MNIQNAIEQYIQEYFNEELDTAVTECLSMVDFSCLLYTTDAADDLLCVDLGGRRIHKTKKRPKKQI